MISTPLAPPEHPRPRGFWRGWGDLLRSGFGTVRRAGAPVLLLMLVLHLVILFLALPLISWLFREALRAGGLLALDLPALQAGSGLTVTFALLLLIVAVAFWLSSLQFSLLLLALRRAQSGMTLTTRDALSDAGRIARKLVRPSAAPLLGYLFLILPLTGFGFTTVLAQGVSIPPFVSGELLKSQASTIALWVFFGVLILLNIRWALALPVFALTDDGGGRALRRSWRLTRGLRAPGSLVAAVLTVLAAAGIVTAALVVVAIVPTALSDELTPEASPVVAAFSLGAAQIAGALLTALVTLLIAGMLLRFFDRQVSAAELQASAAARSPLRGFAVREPAVTPLARDRERRVRRRATGVLVVLAVGGAVALGSADLPVMRSIAQHPETLVLAHRGFSAGGVENTISGLEAAAEAGADLVEIDVMQTRDGRFVVMHDANLSRLAGRDAAVKDLTFDELTAITVSDQFGHTDLIPSLEAYVTRAAELEMPLLIEIKIGGGETEDHVDRLVAELESLDALDTNIYHSLDRPSVERLKSLRPDLTVGYTMAFAAAGAPDTPADFIVVEEWTATEKMQQSAADAGLGFMVWTINDTAGMREMLRRDVDGIITDHPDEVRAHRAEIDDETGLADMLVDALTRFVVVF